MSLSKNAIASIVVASLALYASQAQAYVSFNNKKCACYGKYVGVNGVDSHKNTIVSVSYRTGSLTAGKLRTCSKKITALVDKWKAEQKKWVDSVVASKTCVSSGTFDSVLVNGLNALKSSCKLTVTYNYDVQSAFVVAGVPTVCKVGDKN